MDGIKEIIRRLVYQRLEKELALYIDIEGISVIDRIRADYQAGQVHDREKELLLEVDVRRAVRAGERILTVGRDCIITPLAGDLINEKKIELRRTG